MKVIGAETVRDPNRGYYDPNYGGCFKNGLFKKGPCPGTVLTPGTTTKKSSIRGVVGQALMWPTSGTLYAYTGYGPYAVLIGGYTAPNKPTQGTADILGSIIGTVTDQDGGQWYKVDTTGGALPAVIGFNASSNVVYIPNFGDTSSNNYLSLSTTQQQTQPSIVTQDSTGTQTTTGGAGGGGPQVGPVGTGGTGGTGGGGGINPFGLNNPGIPTPLSSTESTILITVAVIAGLGLTYSIVK